ncbi:hypothetical protein CEQ90_09625 [Lewinellaceae bacterium SD302]|nr:hypothetical protein CEQ90_09625 [Lewinellaceae bacterium SD302]
MKNCYLLFCLFTCIGLYAQSPQMGNLVINEFLASNDSTVADQDGEFDDWVELYNLTDIEISLDNFFLSDDPEELDKWTFPAGTLIPEGGYLIIWADDDEEQEGLHASFKLSADGESLILSDQDTLVIDSLSFPEQFTDTAYARIPNGTGNFVYQSPTFAADNGNAVSVRRVGFLGKKLSVFPNPAAEHVNLTLSEALSEVLTFNLIDATGRVVIDGSIPKGSLEQSISIRELSNGTYFLRFTNGKSVEMRRILVQPN